MNRKDFQGIDINIDDLTVVNDNNWCYSNINWSCTNDDPPVRFNDNKKHTWFSYDKDKNIIEQITFNYVVVHSSHGFGGTSFFKVFYLGNKMVSYSDSVYPTFDECKNHVIKKINDEIHGYQYAIKIREEIIVGFMKGLQENKI